MKKITILALAAFALGSFGADMAQACGAGYIKAIATANTAHKLYNTAKKISQKYMEKMGVDPDSAAGKVIEPFVIGTTLVDAQMGGDPEARYLNYNNYDWTAEQQAYSKGRTWSDAHQGVDWRGHTISNKSTDQAVRESLNCGHHKGHFGDGLHIYNNYHKGGSGLTTALSRAG